MVGKVSGIFMSKGGVPKNPVLLAHVGPLGLHGDDQWDKKHHGGPLRALCLFSKELLTSLQSEGHPIFPGSTGENILVEGLSWELFQPGTKWQIGDTVQIEIQSYTAPCKTIKASFKEDDFVRISQKVHPGWSRIYASVLQEGDLRQGDLVKIIR